MATVDAGTLRWGFEGDTSKLLEAHKKAQDAAKATGEAMATAFEQASVDAGKAIDTFVTRSMEKLAQLAEVAKTGASKLADVWSEGAEGAEKAVTGLFDGVNGALDVMVNSLAAKSGPWGKAFAAAWDIGVGAVVKGKLDEWKPKFAGLLDDVIGGDLGKRTGESFAAAFERATEALLGSVTKTGQLAGFDFGPAVEKAREQLGSLGEYIKELAEGAALAIEKIAGRYQGITEAGQKGIDALTKQNEGLERTYNLLGMTKREAAETAAWMDAIAASGKKLVDLTSSDTQEISKQAEKKGELVALIEAQRAAEQEIKEQERAVTQLTASLQRQGQQQLAVADAITKTAYARALERAQAQAQGTGRKANVADDPRVQAAQEAFAQTAQEAAGIKFNTELAQAIKTTSEAYDLQTRSLGLSAGAAERLKFTQKELNQAQKDGVPITDDLREKIDAAATAVSNAAERASRAKEAFSDFMKVGQTVASSLESAFDKWLNGTKQTWQEFIASLERDLAKLALRMALMPLFGGGGSASILGGIGNSLFGLPGRAEGGDVSAGQAYIVGEKQPELFIPRSSGTIVPSFGGAGGGNQTINMNINLEGANGDETIARISAQAARQAAIAAVQQANDAFPMRQRSLQLLGA